KDALTTAPWAVALPAGLIVALIVGINLLCDDLLADPRTLAVRAAVRTGKSA
ncbi:ABC transporter permease, partial [Nocardia elegans]|nr:ABC transporter permease [Nocardia elegans]